MKTIVHKYKVGDKVRFKSNFPSPTTGLVGREGTVAEITGIGLNYNNKPHYYIDNITGGVFAESCFAGLATESEFLAQQALDPEVDKEQGPETKCDTGDSDESENIQDIIAELSEIRAGYNLFSYKERAKYHALTVAINKLREEA